MKTILLTNDDGFFSPGIQILKKRLQNRFEVTLVAPDRERSAISMALSLHHPLRVKEVEHRVFAVDGTTSDCINLAVQKLLPSRPDFVISGMNIGENLAEDIFFSGTVGGAFSAVLYGIPSLAVSLINGAEAGVDEASALSAAAQISESVLLKLLGCASPDCVYNLNIPFPNNGSIQVTTLGHKQYRPDIVERVDPRGNLYYWIGTGVPSYAGREGTDIWAVQNGFISLSAIHYNMDSHTEISRLAKIF